MSQTETKALYFLKQFIAFLLWLGITAIFLYSPYSKLFQGFDFHKSVFSTKDNFFINAFTLDFNAFDSFRWKFLDLGFNSMVLAGIAARLVIGMELVLGLMLLFRLYLRKFTYPLVIIMLSVFIVYLLYILIVHGNSGDCGCFGNKIEMTPLMAIWKNVLIIIAACLLMYLLPGKPHKIDMWSSLVVLLLSICGPFIVAPLNDDILPATVLNETIDLNPLYNTSPAPFKELRKGKHIIAFMSLTCPHCQKAAYLLQTIQGKNPGIPIYLVLAGHPSQQAEFFKRSHAEAIPHMLFTNTQVFINYTHHPQADTHFGVPAIYWVNNSVIERKSSYYQLDPKEIETWLK